MKTLVRYQKTYVNPSCVDQLNALDRKGKELGWKQFSVVASTNQEKFNPLSPKASGREFIFTTDSGVESLRIVTGKQRKIVSTPVLFLFYLRH